MIKSSESVDSNVDLLHVHNVQIESFKTCIFYDNDNLSV